MEAFGVMSLGSWCPAAGCVVQELRFPPLREMLPDERARLKAKKLPAPEESFCEWLRRLSLVAPDPPL